MNLAFRHYRLEGVAHEPRFVRVMVAAGAPNPRIIVHCCIPYERTGRRTEGGWPIYTEVIPF